MRLTKGEMAIWAAAFAGRGGGFLSVEVAAHAVEEARRLASEPRPESTSPAAMDMLHEMVNRSEANREDDEELGDVLMWLDHRHHGELAARLRADYGQFDDDGILNGSLMSGTHIGFLCPSCGSRHTWMRSVDGSQWRCGGPMHPGFEFRILVDSAEAGQARAMYSQLEKDRLGHGHPRYAEPEVSGGTMQPVLLTKERPLTPGEKR